MKNPFIYPSKKNIVILFILFQSFPYLSLRNIGKLSSLSTWFYFEVVIIACLFLWELKPEKEFDERELAVRYKWKSHMLDYGSSMIIIPISLWALNPAIEGLGLLMSYIIPNFLILLYCTYRLKKETGYFLVEKM